MTLAPALLPSDIFSFSFVISVSQKKKNSPAKLLKACPTPRPYFWQERSAHQMQIAEVMHQFEKLAIQDSPFLCLYLLLSYVKHSERTLGLKFTPEDSDQASCLFYSILHFVTNPNPKFMFNSEALITLVCETLLNIMWRRSKWLFFFLFFIQGELRVEGLSALALITIFCLH